MKDCSSRRGSALLIVLGLLSFIVVSAVAFATYMRYARLPSSYLRRTSASRLLIKAALAEAIEVIDASIGDNPYPGVGTATSYLPRKTNVDGAAINRNYWRDRVYLGWDPGNGQTDGPVGTGDTVATLSVEGLAYLPPPFINDVRYWSRYSLGGIWHNLAFDAGRFAFTAVDVSDCFDINRLEAAAARDSSDMGRITLAHCFKTESGDMDVAKAKAWDSFMANFIDPSGSKVPLVSMADWNLAVYDKNPKGITSPFIEHFTKGTKFVTAETGAEAEMLKRMAFITESYSAGTNGVDYLDLTDVNNQPQFMADAEGDSEKENEDGLQDILTVTNDKFIQHLTSNKVNAPVSRLLPAVLYDYLDRDSVPCSLAIPTVERTPMITGLTIVPQRFNIDVEATPKEIPGAMNPATGQPKDYTRITVGKLSVNANFIGRMSVVYPFKYEHGSKKPKFKAQLAASIAFVTDFDKSKNFRVDQNSKPAASPRAWPTSKKVEEKKLGNAKVPTLITLFSELKDIPLKVPVDTEKDAVPADLSFTFDDTAGISFNAQFDNLPALPDNAAVDAGTFLLIQKLDAAKSPIGDPVFRTNFAGADAQLKELVRSVENQETVFYPVVQLWARIVDENDKVVDLVPACLADDEKPFAALGSVMKGSRDSSAFRFVKDSQMSAEDVALKVSPEILSNPPAITIPKFDPQGFIAGDPRYNYAAENWMIAADGGSSLGSVWLEKNRNAFENGDGDIFMTTSDASYLQSVYELAMMPDLAGTGQFSKTMTSLDSGYNGTPRSDFGGMPASGAMWQTLCTKEAFAQMRNMKVTSGTKGFRVNPNTREVDIMMAALANSPMDWWAASTNETVKGNLVTESKIDPDRMVLDLTKNAKYMFNERGEYLSVDNEKLETLANRFLQVFSAAGVQNQSWQEAFDNLDWDTDDQIAGVDLDTPLHSVDRKFLHGYWHECFDNRQQLFLLFLRAEPAMMGGSLGQTPPQLGARAVALVWRDPNKPTPKQQGGASNQGPVPHRTRVLFYRQLD